MLDLLVTSSSEVAVKLDVVVPTLRTSTVERLLRSPREQVPNSWHRWMSCYGGLFGAVGSACVQQYLPIRP